jgi:hypothetical protein
MMKEQALKRLKEQLRAVEADIDRIVLSGGIVGYGDPLVQEAYALRTKIGKLFRSGR